MIKLNNLIYWKNALVIKKYNKIIIKNKISNYFIFFKKIKKKKF